MTEFKKFSVSENPESDYGIPLDILLETLVGLLFTMFGASMRYSNFIPVEAGSVAAKIPFS